MAGFVTRRATGQQGSACVAARCVTLQGMKVTLQFFFSCLVVLVFVAAPSLAVARHCGESRPCQCGDVVTDDYTMTANLGPCEKRGLAVASGVTLDCGKQTIRGSGERSEDFGIALQKNATGATIRNCIVTGFQRGIRLKDVKKNKILFNTVHKNGNFSSQVGYGIDVAGAQENIFKGNFVHHNADEGIHVGTGSHGNTFLNNRVEDNGRENFYFLSADKGMLRENSTRGGGSSSVFIKHSAFLHLEKNTFHDKPVILRGNAHDNVLIDNEVLNAGVRFQPYEEQGSWTYPSKNLVSGGKISGASECLSFASAAENMVKDVALSECGRALVLKADVGPTENTIIGIPFTPKAALLDEKSILHVGWRLEILVKEKSGTPVVGANVRGVDAKRQAVFEAVTDTTGAIPPQDIIEQTRRGDTGVTHMPLLVRVSVGKNTVSQEVNVTKHTAVTITFPENSR